MDNYIRSANFHHRGIVDIPLDREVMAMPESAYDRNQKITWRVGNRVPVNLYRDDVIAGQCQSAEIAAEIVAGMQQAARVRELEAAIKAAPHARECGANYYHGTKRGPLPCDCWKSKVRSNA